MDASALAGGTVVLTGATLGIGAALADAFQRAGARTVLAARHPPEELADTDDRAVVGCDVAVEEDRERLVATAVQRFGSIDVLVNNAGFARSAPAVEESRNDVERSFATNVTGPFHLCSLAAAYMRGRGGSIVNVSSVVGSRVMDRYPLASYAASKAALAALTRELAAQWGRDGIRVNAVAPGWFPTRMNGHLEDADQRGWVESHTSLGRPGRVEEMVGPVLFLATDASSYVTGQVLAVDGGWI